jgi:hypothetical protein
MFEIIVFCLGARFISFSIFRQCLDLWDKKKKLNLRRKEAAVADEDQV